MERFFPIFYGEHTILPEPAFVKCLETKQRNNERCRYEVYPTHPPAFSRVSDASLRINLNKKPI
jgi:hypothetical protein